MGIAELKFKEGFVPPFFVVMTLEKPLQILFRSDIPKA